MMSSSSDAALQTARQIGDSVWWIPSCLSATLSGNEMHVHNSPYLIVGPTKTLLFDTGHPLRFESMRQSLAELLAGRELDYIVPSHSEPPHCGNLPKLLDHFPEAVVPGNVQDYHLMFPDYADRLHPLSSGAAVPLGGNVEFTLMPALLRDLPGTQWGYLGSSRVLFTADAFAWAHRQSVEGDDRPVHLPGECRLMASELPRRPDFDHISWIVEAAFHWARFVPTSSYRSSFDDLLRVFPSDVVAPAHGGVIDDMDMLDLIWSSLDRSFDPDLNRDLPSILGQRPGKVVT